MRLSLTLILLLLTGMAGLVNAASTELLLDISPAWDGKARPGRASELVIGIFSDTGGEASWKISHPRFEIESPLMLQAGVPFETRTTLPIVDSDPPVFEFVGPDATTIRRVIRFDLVAEPLVMLQPPAETFPGSAAGYDAIDLLVVDRETLIGLHKNQLLALQQYVGSCGRVVFADGRVWRQWKEMLACGGANSVTVASDDDIPAAIDALLRKPRDSYASAISLAGLLANPLVKLGWWLGAFFAFYLLVSVLSLLAGKPGNRMLVILFATSSASSVLLLLGLSLWGDMENGVVWDEIHAGGDIASSSRLTIGVATGKSLHHLQDFAIPDTTNTLAIREQNGDRYLVNFSRPLALNTVYEKQTRHQEPGMSLSYSNGLPVIRHGAKKHLNTAYLLHDERVYTIPVVEPSGHWLFDETAAEAASTALTKLMRKRAGQGDALLINMTEHGKPRMQHWVLVKSVSVPPGILR